MARLGYGLAARSAKLGALALVWLVGIAGCARSRPPEAPPAEPTRALVKEARRAEAERRYDRADALYQRARRGAPDSQSRAYASREHGRALAFWGQDERAREAFESAVASDPDLADAWHDLGILRYRAGTVESAEIALRRAAALRPADPRPRVALAAIYVNGGRFDEARAAYRELLELDIPQRLREAIGEALALLDAEQSR